MTLPLTTLRAALRRGLHTLGYSDPNMEAVVIGLSEEITAEEERHALRAVEAPGVEVRVCGERVGEDGHGEDGYWICMLAPGHYTVTAAQPYAVRTHAGHAAVVPVAGELEAELEAALDGELDDEEPYAAPVDLRRTDAAERIHRLEDAIVELLLERQEAREEARHWHVAYTTLAAHRGGPNGKA